MPIIKNCLVTKSDATIVNPYDVARKQGEMTKKEFHTGIDLFEKSKTAYAVCHCVVTYVGYNTDEKHVVCVQYNSIISFRYCNLSEVLVEEGDLIEQGSPVGKYDKFIHFECLNKVDKSEWPVRIWGRQYYKQDPLSFIDGSFTFDLRSQYPVWKLDSKYWDANILIQSGEVELGGDMIVQGRSKERNIQSPNKHKRLRNRGHRNLKG